MSLHLVPRGLLYVEAVADHGSIQAASRAMGIAASAIDRQVILIEERLGVKLFDRVPTGMELSPAGEMLVVLARRWRGDENRVWSDVKKMQGVDLGHIRLVAMDSLANWTIPRFLRRVSAEYPKVRIDVEIATPDVAVVALDEGRADIALAFNLRPQRDIHVTWTEDLPLICIAAPDHPLAGRSETTLRDVRRFPLVLQSRALAIRRILEARHATMVSDERPPIVTNSLQLLKHLVAAGPHVALTSEVDAAQEILSGRLIAIDVSEAPLSKQSISIAVSSRRPLPRICRVVADTLAEDMKSCLDEVRSFRRASAKAQA